MALDPSLAAEAAADVPTRARTDERPAAVVAALSVYVDPLVADARVAIVGDGELGLQERLLELGARTVHVYDPDPVRVARIVDDVPRGVSVRMLRDEFDVRDGAFDLVVIPDIGILPDAAAAIVRLRRVIDPRGAVVAMGRARTSQGDLRDGGPAALFAELSPPVVEYAELYDLFALQFESVTMTGVLPFAGVVFAELGAGDDLAVSVDTRLVDPEPPSVFVVAAGREAALLDPYAIVQVTRSRESDALDTVAVEIVRRESDSRDHDVATAFAAMQLKAELLAAQLDEHRDRLATESRLSAEQASLVERFSVERDRALSRALELEGVVGAAQQAFELLDRRLASAEQGLLERDDQIAELNAELDASESADAQQSSAESADPAVVAGLRSRAERAESSLALHVVDLSQLGEAHASETARLEDQLRERARVISAMEKELGRREQLVRELVVALEEAREGSAENALVFESAPTMPGVAPEEVVRLRRKLDDLALQVARREGELVARAWRITELENEKARLQVSLEREAAAAAAARALPPPPPKARAQVGATPDLEGELLRTRDEIDALRQALTQEHAARVAAESGEELSRAREELARQAVLLEQMKGRATHPQG